MTDHAIEAEVFFNWADGYPLHVAWRIECTCGWEDTMLNVDVLKPEDTFVQALAAFRKHVTKVQSRGVLAASLEAQQ